MVTLNSVCEGGCTCGYVRYKIAGKPLITHCCHCRFCQKQTGAAFALNALFFASYVQISRGAVEEIMTASPSGKGQNIVRCPKCRVAIWSHYFMGGLKENICFIRVGTLDNPDQFPPDVHIFTTTKQPWVQLPANTPVFDVFYDYEKMWSKENNAHRKNLLANIIDI